MAFFQGLPSETGCPLRPKLAWALLALSALITPRISRAESYFAIRIVDEQSGRGVPLVELRTTNHLRFVTDSAGLIAFHEPGLLHQKVFFHVASHGYEFPQDGFGLRGRAVMVEPGGAVTLAIRRLNIAERLYRVTGGGIYADSLLLGRETPLREAQLNAQVFGQDSVLNALYRGKLFWIWGDTNRPAYPLGNFHVAGATSLLPAAGGLDPDVGIDLNYFKDDRGFAREMARMPGDGPTWINGLIAISAQDASSANPREKLYATYLKVRPPLTVYRRGLSRWDDDTERFESLREFEVQQSLAPSGHAFEHRDANRDFIYFGDPFPLTRVAASEQALLDFAAYEGFTCLKTGSGPSNEVDRDPEGKPVWSWRRGARPIDYETQEQLVRSGKLTRDEGWLNVQPLGSDKPIQAHRGSVSWNPLRKRWIMIFTESGGSSSYLGEVWFSEAIQPEGPYRKAVKVATHDRYSFYNPKQHPYFSKGEGRFVYFEGTYTTTFSGNDAPTPRYEYNQIMYRLDLTDPRLSFTGQAGD